jgi:hypothetical protein
MRPFTHALCILLGVAAPCTAAHEPHDERPVTREEVREKKEALRELTREYREQERRRRQAARRPRAWVGAQAGLAHGSIDTCAGTSAWGCNDSARFGTYSANVTLTGPGGGLRFRATRGANKGDLRRMPYEQAVLPVFRFGQSDWYGGFGWGRIVHPHDDYEGDLDCIAYDFFWAPGSRGAGGFELSFHGLGAEDGGYGSVNLGLRFGKLR